MKRRKSSKEKENFSNDSLRFNKRSAPTKHSVPWVGDVSATKVCVLTFLAVSGTAIVLHDLGYLSSSKPHSSTFHSRQSQSPSAISNGGWRTADDDVIHKYSSSVCLLQRVFADELTAQRFETEFRNKKPLIIKFRNGAKSWTKPELWSVDGLKHAYGQWLVFAGLSREIVRNSGNGYIETSFSDFVDKLTARYDGKQEPFYVFDRDFIKDSELLNTLRPPVYLNISNQLDDSFFFLGSSGSGVAFHNHAEAWNAVVYGSKRWFLYYKEQAPPGGVYPGYSQLDWFKKVYPRLSEENKPIECVQQAGEIIYLPEGMYHGTINIGDTIAVGIQKKEATITEMKLQYGESQLSRQGSGTVDRRFECIQKLHSLLPDNAEWEMKLGVMLFKEMRQPGDGISHIERALELDPFFVVALINLADFQAEIGQYEEAERNYLHALSQNPDAWDVYSQYGTFLFNQKRFSDAAPLFKKGFELKPNEKGFLVYLQDTQTKMGDHDAARMTQQMLKDFKEM